MSKTLEERVAALEWCIHDKFPEYDLVTMVGRFAATSDPQEPYRLDTKPRTGAVEQTIYRDPECVKNWPECVDGDYHPNCCRFPKSCSCSS